MINRIIDFSANNKLIVFLVVAAAALMGWWSMKNLSLDAIPDLSETQVIIYSRWDRSPDIIEDQVTYPIVTSMLGAPGVRTVRGFSDFGYSFVYVIFDDGTDIYWARARTQEYLSAVLPRLPQGVQTELGPDATGLGWVFQYVLVDTTGQQSLAELRSYQDWYLRYYLKAVPGVAEVAPVGGFRRQYQVNLDPNRLQFYNIPVSRVVEAVRGNNNDAGGRLIEFGGTEYMVRGLGYARSTQDFGNIALSVSENGSPIRIRDVGEVVLGPDLRRGITDLNGTGEAVSGIVVMRQGQNTLEVIERVKKKIREIEPGLPPGVKIVPVYDRSELINRSIDNLKWTLLEVVITVSLIVLLFLWHIPSAVIPITTIPLAILISFIPFRLMGVSANIMSLAGIAIAVGAMVDAAIVVVEQTHKKLELWDQEGRKGDYRDVVVGAVKEVGGTSFFALLVIAVSFLPVLTLEAQEGRLFRPLAYTKTLSMIVAAVLAITLDPAMRLLFTHVRNFSFRPLWLCRTVNAVAVGTIVTEQRHRLSRFLIRIYEPVVVWSLRRKWSVIGAAVILVLVTIPVFQKLGSEFMPPLDEGSLFYMPTTMPGISVTEAQRLLQTTDRIIKGFPEVDQVLGKAGRAETSTDPAPLSMLETLITLKPKSAWRKVDTWYSFWAPDWLKPVFRRVTPDSISSAELVDRMNEALKLPGLSNAWTMPIKGRIDMLTTGIRTPVGLKISGANLVQIEQIGAQAEAVLRQLKGTRSVFAERTGGGYFLDIDWNRDELARYGLSIDQAQEAVQNAIGGENIATTIEGRERYAVNVRYQRDFRSNPEAIGRVLVPLDGGRKQISLSQLAEVSDGLCLCGHCRSGSGKLHRGGGPPAPRKAGAAGRIRRRLERAVRGDAAGPGAPVDRGAADPAADRPAALSQYPLPGEDGHRAAGGPLLGGGGRLVHPSARLQHEHRRLGGAHRASRRGCGNGGLHAPLPGPGVQAGPEGGAHEHPFRSAGGDHPWGGQAHPAQVHDRGHHAARPRSHHVVLRHGGRCHEAYRRADGGRNLDLLPDGTGRLPADLRDLEMELRDEKAADPGGGMMSGERILNFNWNLTNRHSCGSGNPALSRPFGFPSSRE
jgi:Cu(I)/Ag(I) efflux system membrane protein CusA/SilA